MRERRPSCGLSGARLTVKLRGRTTTPAGRRGRTLSPGARVAKQITHHGPLQRWLDRFEQRRITLGASTRVSHLSDVCAQRCAAMCASQTRANASPARESVKREAHYQGAPEDGEGSQYIRWKRFEPAEATSSQGCSPAGRSTTMTFAMSE